MLAAPDAFMASIDVRKEQHRNQSTSKFVPPVAIVSKEEATRPNIKTSISTSKMIKATLDEKIIAHHVKGSTTDIISVETTTAADKPMVSGGFRSKPDLMDLDIDQETTQPVLQFTATSMKKPSHCIANATWSFDQQIEALKKSGVLSANQLEVLESIRTQVHACKNAATPVAGAPAEEPPRQGVYTKSELVSLRPANISPEITAGIAKKFAEQQNAFLIGEHVHKTRYHTAASLTEDFEKLSISDKKPAKPAAASLLTAGRSTINPFGPPPTKSKGPSLPAHLLNQATTADHGAAARAQYSGGSDTLAPISTGQSLGDSASTTRATRRNMINQTGFVGLAEGRLNSIAAGKKGEDPLLVARN